MVADAPRTFFLDCSVAFEPLHVSTVRVDMYTAYFRGHICGKSIEGQRQGPLTWRVCMWCRKMCRPVNSFPDHLILWTRTWKKWWSQWWRPRKLASGSRTKGFDGKVIFWSKMNNFFLRPSFLHSPLHFRFLLPFYLFVERKRKYKLSYKNAIKWKEKKILEPDFVLDMIFPFFFMLLRLLMLLVVVVDVEVGAWRGIQFNLISSVSTSGNPSWFIEHLAPDRTDNLPILGCVDGNVVLVVVDVIIPVGGVGSTCLEDPFSIFFL